MDLPDKHTGSTDLLYLCTPTNKEALKKSFLVKTISRVSTTFLPKFQLFLILKFIPFSFPTSSLPLFFLMYHSSSFFLPAKLRDKAAFLCSSDASATSVMQVLHHVFKVHQSRKLLPQNKAQLSTKIKQIAYTNYAGTHNVHNLSAFIQSEWQNDPQRLHINIGASLQGHGTDVLFT